MHSRFSVAVAVSISLAFAGCAGSSVTPATPLANNAPQSGSAALRVKPDASYKKALYVADASTNTVTILSDKKYHQMSTITNGISDPFAESMDQHGNLYVANGSGSVTEYAPGATSPSFTYNTGMEFAFAVTVDLHGNVYEGDYDGYVSEYAQGSNQTTAACQSPNYPYSAASAVAVDRHGDVFVAESNDAGGIWEYSGGLAGCHAKLLTTAYDYNINALALDSSDDLIATAEYQNGVLILAPPYSSITRTIGNSYGSLLGLSLNKKNKLLFVAQSGVGVLVFNYQSGNLVKTIGSGQGISNAAAVVDGPNAVY